MLADARTGQIGRHALVGLLRQSVFGRLAGYEDVNDAERLCHDPAMRKAVRHSWCEILIEASVMARGGTLGRPSALPWPFRSTKLDTKIRSSGGCRIEGDGNASAFF
jgi:hypothetical protein